VGRDALTQLCQSMAHGHPGGSDRGMRPGHRRPPVTRGCA
jgi:hypothetical protein